MQALNGSSTATAFTGAVSLAGLTLMAGAGAAATLTVHDGTSAAGTIVAQVAAAQGTTAVLTGLNVICLTGLHAVISGAGAAFTLYVK